MGNKAPTIEASPAELAAQKIAAKKWEMYQTQFLPVENQFIERATGFAANPDDPEGAFTQTGKGYNAERYYQQAEGNANIGSQSAISKAVTQGIRQARDPNRFNAIIDRGAITGAISQSDVTNRSAQSVQDRYLSSLQQVSQMGMGRSTDAQHGMMEIASQANRQAISDATQQADRGAGTGHAIGQTAGAISRHYKEG